MLTPCTLSPGQVPNFALGDGGDKGCDSFVRDVRTTCFGPGGGEDIPRLLSPRYPGSLWSWGQAGCEEEEEEERQSSLPGTNPSA